MSDLPSYELEEKAAEERRRLHSAVTQLRLKVRDRLDVQKNTREHLGPICGVTGLLAFVVGYSFTGIFAS